ATSDDCVARWRIGRHARSVDRITSDPAPYRTGPRSPCACPWLRRPDRFALPLPSRTCSDALQHAHQLLQCTRIEPAPHFDSPPAVQHHRQRAARRGDSCGRTAGHLHGQQSTAASRRLPFPSAAVPAQSAQPHPPLPAELDPAQSARFVLRNYLLDLLPVPPAPYCAHLFIIHAPTSSRNSLREQMGWSDAYGIPGFNNSTGLSAYFRYLGISQSPPKRRITPSSSPVWPRGTRALASRELGGTNRDGIVESVQIVSLLVERPT